MNESAAPVIVDLRIPGRWSSPKELAERLPEECRLTTKGLLMPDGTHVELGAMEADGQFAAIFRLSCRQPATADELAAVDAYTVNVTLSGPGGSLAAARTMMQAGAAIVKAGGAGVFNDNSTLAHGGQAWLDMAEDGTSDAVSFAFVAIIRGENEVWTMGMHVLGLRDLVMKRADIEADGFDIVEVIRYLARSDKPIADGHLIADLDELRFQVFAQAPPKQDRASPIHNPFGRFKLVSMRDVCGEELDAGESSCVLRNSENAKIVADALPFFDGKRCDTSAFVEMPNHVHVLVRLRSPTRLEELLKSWKGYTARRINQRLGKRVRKICGSEKAVGPERLS